MSFYQDSSGSLSYGKNLLIEPEILSKKLAGNESFLEMKASLFFFDKQLKTTGIKCPCSIKGKFPEC